MQRVPSMEKEEERGESGVHGKTTKGTVGEEASTPHKGKSAERRKEAEKSRERRSSVCD